MVIQVLIAFLLLASIKIAKIEGLQIPRVPGLGLLGRGRFGKHSACIAAHNYVLSRPLTAAWAVSEDTNQSLGRVNIPNSLTLGRVALIPFFILSFVLRKKTAGVMIYVVSCLTDLVDGYLARKLNQKTSFGAFLDPVADKLMVGTALVFLVCQIPTWWFALPVTLILTREIAVSALREWMAEKGQRATVKVGALGKLKTAFQMLSTAMLLEACPGAADFDIALSVGLSRPTLFSLGVGLLYLASALTLVSGFQYFQASWGVLKKAAIE